MPLRPSSIRNNPEKCNIFDDFDNILYDNECWAYRTNGGTVATPAARMRADRAHMRIARLAKKMGGTLYWLHVVLRCQEHVAPSAGENLSHNESHLEFGFCAITPDNQDNRIFWCASTVLGTTWMGRTSSGGTLSTVDSGVGFDTKLARVLDRHIVRLRDIFHGRVAYAPLTTNISSSLMSPYMRATNDGANIRTLTIDVVEGDRRQGLTTVLFANPW